MRNMSRGVLALTFVLLAAMVAGCGRSNPVAATEPSGTSGATIHGTVLGASVSSRAASSNGNGTTVTVVGTNITVTVGATGTFTITGVPSGDITLKFHGNFGDANVQITQVQTGDTITITITITGTTATTETEVRDSTDNQRQVEGLIQSINYTTGTFVVAGKTITTNTSTVIRHGNQTYAIDDLVVGERVHVAGTPSGDGVLATTVLVQNTHGAVMVTLNGTVSALTVTNGSFQFTVNGTTVKGDATTKFQGRYGLSDLANGKQVEVKGNQADGYVQATSIKIG